jgi:hypothetical protein
VLDLHVALLAPFPEDLRLALVLVCAGRAERNAGASDGTVCTDSFVLVVYGREGGLEVSHVVAEVTEIAVAGRSGWCAVSTTEEVIVVAAVLYRRSVVSRSSELLSILAEGCAFACEKVRGLVEVVGCVSSGGFCLAWIILSVSPRRHIQRISLNAPLSNSSNDGKRSAMFAAACDALCVWLVGSGPYEVFVVSHARSCWIAANCLFRCRLV